MNLKKILLASCYATLLVTGCTYMSQGLLIDEKRNAVILDQDAFGDSAEQIVYLEQNWGRYDSLWFYNTTQGSDFLPYPLFLHLEQAGSDELFRSSTNMSRLRYLPQLPSFDNPDGLPVGFVKDSYEGADYMGFTCAACHTTQINYQGTGIRIDGGPSLADFEGLLLDLEKALQATLADQAKFKRLADKLIAAGFADDETQVRNKLQAIYQEKKRYNETNAPRHNEQLVHYGYSRLDAFGRIFNRILEHLVAPGVDNSNPANAPVSYPFLWDTPQSDFVQWNGVGDNNTGDGLQGYLEPLGRNTGEVLGVFATFDLKNPGKKGYLSSANTRNLVRLERQLGELQSPLWPEHILPPIDRDLAAKGRKVFHDYQCAACHGDPATFDRSADDRRVYTQFASLGQIQTDPTMALNALQYQGKSGYFEGQEIPRLKPVSTFPPVTPVLPALQKAVEGVILEPDHEKSFIRRWAEHIYDLLAAVFDNPIKSTQRRVDFEVVPKDAPLKAQQAALAAYKGRMLNGIWATAPYLHNGSVANLYELFLPVCNDAANQPGIDCRSEKFTLGSREFDPVKVGFVSKSKADYPGLFEFDTLLPSNSNAGHEYAAGRTPVIKRDADGKAMRDGDGNFVLEWLPPIDEEQRWALVEYLKSI